MAELRARGGPGRSSTTPSPEEQNAMAEENAQTDGGLVAGHLEEVLRVPARHTHDKNADETEIPRSQAVSDILVATLRAKAEGIKTKYVGLMDEELTKAFDDFIVEATRPTHTGITSFSESAPRQSHRPNGQIVRKEFHPRASVLTDLFEIPHILTIRYVFVAILIIFGMNTVLQDIFDHGTIGVDFHIWTWAFGKFPYVVTFWCLMQTTTLLVVFVPLCHWGRNRTRSDKLDAFDYFWLCCYVLYQIGFALIPFWFVNYFDLPPASTSIIVAEQVRFIMKSHAFVRENITVIMRSTAAHEHAVLPKFSNYVYFQFVPTLVYRDNYPRNKEIRWHFVLMNFAHVAAGISYTYYIFVRFCMPVFRNFNHEHVNLKTFVKSIFDCILPGSLNLLVVFYALLHAWMNAFAEMLRFADRMFYRDWWNSTTFGQYYRTWNVVVHDWLYTYIYSDMYQLCGSRFRESLCFVTFVLSAVVS
ncbi:Sterol O-acyltransferase 1 [Hypsibius exemplaris]|uniref:O-acyltransferase n=1 Tax=Hypsibius exemplaris TaxID=2072580 RepID=A0A1W0WU14_HYPEX|nr:Sterol O-acyltransferase 1 [Hypsibius exemplaris]